MHLEELHYPLNEMWHCSALNYHARHSICLNQANHHYKRFMTEKEIHLPTNLIIYFWATAKKAM